MQVIILLYRTCVEYNVISNEYQSTRLTSIHLYDCGLSDLPEILMIEF